MKNIFILSIVALVVTASCTTPSKLTKGEAYQKMYEQNTLAIAPMPPINKTNNVEAKEFLYSTFTRPLAEQGYYVMPAFLTMEMFKSESAYDAEMFINGDLKRFGEILGADAVLFTVIHKWEKAALNATVTVDIEYILKSTKDNSEIFSRRGTIVYDASLNASGGGLVGALVGMAANALNTAGTDHVTVARAANIFTIADMPAGTYRTDHGKDKSKLAGAKVFKATVK